MYCLSENATDPIWGVLASSDGISSWTPLKPQHTNPNRLANQLWCIDFLSPPTPLIIFHRLPAFVESQKTDARFMQDSRKAVWSIPYVSVALFPSLKLNFIAYRSYSRPDCIFEIHQLWQSGFSRVYSNSCCSCWFELEIIKIGQSSHKMYSNNIVNFQECTTILNACTKISGNLLNVRYIYIYIYIYTYIYIYIIFALFYVFINPVLVIWFWLIWFLYLMAYKPSWVIKCQSYLYRRTVLIIFNPYPGVWRRPCLSQRVLV